MSGGLDTLCGNAYGSQQFKLLGVYLQRGVMVGNIVVCMVAIIFFASEPILLGMGQPKEVAHWASAYVQIFVARQN